ncbi:MAG: omptin family outer membrane protease [Chlamydiae bacterium]|nr:omptin family outer membrane protease [Chlamydiota bacterium]MBI3276689.1 omptin family outer membrane protease [Chlamydiota bacterium]
MKNKIVLLPTLFYFIFFYSQLPHASNLETDLKVSDGYRVDHFDWNIAGDINGQNPNILSELTWKDLEINEIKGEEQILIHKKILLKGSIAYGWILDGKNQDSDFAGDDRTLEFSRSINGAGGGNTLDGSLGAGLQWHFFKGNLSLTPLGGYSYHEQNLRIGDGIEFIPTSDSIVSIPLTGPTDTYDTQWKGPWIGLDLVTQPTEKITLSLEFQYHWADYEAVADWHMREDFAHPVSFRHEADGNGIVFSMGTNYALSHHGSIFFNIGFEQWSTDPGIDHTFVSDGTVEDYRLNEVNWKSLVMRLGLGFHF